jgi:uncharacterized glyoxalase superfamily protein PhnB
MMRPFITMQGQAKDALDFYQAVFTSFEMISLQHHSEPHEKLIMLAVFSVDEQEIMISDSFITHDWEINPGISFFINLDQEEQLHELAEKLGANGNFHMPPGDYGFSKLFAWVEDQFGVNWQLNIA